MEFRSLAAWTLLLSLISAPAFAQLVDHWEKPKGAPNLPISEPTAVDIYLPRKELYAAGSSSNAMMGMAGPIAGSFLQGKENNRNARDSELAETLRTSMPAVDYAAFLRETFGKHIGTAQFTNIKRVTVHYGTPADIEKASPGDPTERTLALVVLPYFGPFLCDLRIGMTARLGTRAAVTGKPRNKSLSFSQIFAYDVPGNCGIIAREEKQRAFWTDMGPVAVGNHIRAGMDGVMAMLQHALATPPRFGPFPGKQVPWSEGQALNSGGVVEARVADRVVVRLRNGMLLSLPATDRRIPYQAH